MILKNIYQSIEKSTMTSIEGVKSKVFELLPPDIEQMDESELMHFQNSISVFLNQLSSKEDNFQVQAKKLLKNKEEKDDWYKFYHLKNRLFLNTTKLDLEIPFCELRPVDDPFVSLIGLDDFYSDVLVMEDYVHFNSMYLRLISLYEMPKTLFMSEIQSFGDLILNIKKNNQMSSKRRVQTQRRLHFANLHKSMRNLESEASYIEAEKLTESMMMGTEQVFEVEGFLILKEESLEKLNETTKKLTSSLKNREISFLIESVSLSTLFPSLLFGIDPLFKRSHECPTSYVVNLLPLKKDKLMTEGYAFSSLIGEQLNFRLFNSESLNFNALFTGVSGSGKSMCAQKLVMEEINQGAKAVILDLGNSFDKLAKYHEANIFSKKFNPLQFRDPKYLKEFVISVIPESEITAKMEGKLFELILKNYEDAESFKSLIQKITSDIPELDLYFAELWDFFTDEKVLISDLTYVNTSDFPDKIKAPLIIYLIEYFKHLEGRKIFVFDEVWSFLRKNASYVEESFRTFRKENASAIAISQALHDFTSTPLGRVIADLSYYKFLFSQNTDEVSGLTSFDKEKIKSIKSKKGFYSEFYLKTESLKKVLRFYPTTLEYVLFNTEPVEKIELQKFETIFAPFFGFKNIIERFIDFKYLNKGMKHA